MTALEKLNLRLQELEHFAKKSLGQNFLISDVVIKRIIQAAESFNSKKIIEIGPGCGALTDDLKKLASEFKVIELDRKLAEYWRHKNLDVIEADALQADWTPYSGWILVSNLPYQISSSIVIDRSLEDSGLDGMVLMFQKEVAQRIRAAAQTEAYGMLSVIAQEFWTIELVSEAGPRDFKPPPKVASRVLKFTKKNSSVTHRNDYLQFVKKSFQQRRRLLSSNLKGSSWLNSEVKLKNFEDWLISNKFPKTVRAEELSPQQLLSLYNVLNS